MHKTDGNGVRDAVGGRLVRIENAVELAEIRLVFGEERAGENVA